MCRLGKFAECYNDNRAGGPVIALYDYVCRCYDTNADLRSRRQSNNYCPDFTDRVLMIIYLFGLIEQRVTFSQTYKYICDHWANQFPQLPSYQAVNYRISTISDHFLPLMEGLVEQAKKRPKTLRCG